MADLSIMEEIALLPPGEAKVAMDRVAAQVGGYKNIPHSWILWARPSQLPPDREWTTWLIRSGRGFGKTRAGAEWVIRRAMEGHGPVALVGQTKADVRDTMIEVGASAIMNVAPPDFMPKYEPSKRRLTFPNGVVATVFSGDEPDQLRGPQHATVWSDELAKWRYPDLAYDNISFGLRVGDAPKHMITTTPRPIPVLREILDDPATVDVTGSTYDNLANLPEPYIKAIFRRYNNTRLGLQEIFGHILDDVEGALWTSDMIESRRVNSVDYSELVRVGVGVDPKASVTANSETGIVVAGMTADRHIYVLDDKSIDGTPGQWGAAVLRAYRQHQANLVIAEVNNGGDMVEHTIRTIRDSQDRPIGLDVPILQVRAARGKKLRAEPIVNLYEQGRVHHVGMLAELEGQMLTWVPEESRSPDRVDALVWAIWALAFPLKRKKGNRGRRGRRGRHAKAKA